MKVQQKKKRAEFRASYLGNKSEHWTHYHCIFAFLSHFLCMMTVFYLFASCMPVKNYQNKNHLLTILFSISFHSNIRRAFSSQIHFKGVNLNGVLFLLLFLDHHCNRMPPTPIKFWRCFIRVLGKKVKKKLTADQNRQNSSTINAEWRKNV